MTCHVDVDAGQPLPEEHTALLDEEPCLVEVDVRLDSAEKTRSRDMRCPVRGIPCNGRAETRFLVTGADERSQ